MKSSWIATALAALTLASAPMAFGAHYHSARRAHRGLRRTGHYLRVKMHHGHQHLHNLVHHGHM